MTTRRIIYDTPDGGVAVIIPAPDGRRVGESLADWLTRVAAKVVPPGATGVRVIEAADLPPRRFRRAWKRILNAVDVDLPLARLLLLAAVRERRNARLRDSDSVKARFDDVGTIEQKAELAAYRQQLRDLPAVVEAEIAPLDLAALTTYEANFPPVVE